MSSRATTTDAPLLQLRGISKAFPGVQALHQVDFSLSAGKIHALLGENGAGKSTLIKVLTGVHRCDEGDIRLLDGRIEPHSPREAERLGIATVYQEINLIPQLSVAENLFIGRELRRWGLIDWKAMRRFAEQALLQLNLSIDVSQPVDSFSIAIQQMVAIARALDQQARVLILDEPTSSLDAAEVDQLFSVMRSLRDQGMGIIFISHFLDQVFAISDQMTILRNGTVVGEYATSDLDRLKLISLMLGRNAEEVVGHNVRESEAPHATAKWMLETRKLGKRHEVRSLNLGLREGEVVGLAGLLGAGRTETVKLLFGIDRFDTGELIVADQAIDRQTPRRAIGQRMALAPEDRKAAGIIPELSVRENIVLALQARRGWLQRISDRKQREITAKFVEALRIATPDLEKPAGQLSGGNQQKVILARWLAMQPKILILDEPTRGIDVGAKAEIERLIEELCREGMALLFISSELEEVVRASHRVVVLRDRHQVVELIGDEVTLGGIMRMIAGTEIPATEERKDV